MIDQCPRCPARSLFLPCHAVLAHAMGAARRSGSVWRRLGAGPTQVVWRRWLGAGAGFPSPAARALRPHTASTSYSGLGRCRNPWGELRHHAESSSRTCTLSTLPPGQRAHSTRRSSLSIPIERPQKPFNATPDPGVPWRSWGPSRSRCCRSSWPSVRLQVLYYLPAGYRERSRPAGARPEGSPSRAARRRSPPADPSRDQICLGVTCRRSGHE